MIALGLRTEQIKPGDNLIQVVQSSLTRYKLTLKDEDILIVASKIISTIENRMIKISDVTPSSRALSLALKYDLEPGFVQLVIDESDEVLGGVYKALLTLKDGFLIANAGIDVSNTPKGYAILWPENPNQTAEALRKNIMQKTNKNIGVVISDSRTVPLRYGTIAISIASAGFNPLKNYVSKKDIFGKTLMVTRQSVADEIACAAHLVMGEADEKKPIALIRDIELDPQETIDSESIKIPKEQCLYMKVLLDLKANQFKEEGA